MRPLLVTVLASLLASCSGSRFVGVWLFETPPHALIDLHFVSLEMDGTVTQWGVGTPLGARSRSGTLCQFGGSWRSDGPERIRISGCCTDGVERTIVLGLSGPGSGHTPEARAEVIEVDGETTWSLSAYWLISKYASLDDAMRHRGGMRPRLAKRVCAPG